MHNSTVEKHKFGLFALILFGINGIIGTGIFLLPGQVYQLVGNAGILVAILDALLVLTIALSFAEASSRFHENGGAFLYTKSAFGEFPGYLVGFMTYVIRIIAWSAMVAGLSTVLGVTFPVLGSTLWQKLIPVILIVALTILNLAGVQFVKVANSIATIAKLIPLILFIAIGIFFFNTDNLTPLVPAHTTVAHFGTAAVTLLYAFTGFETMTIAAEDYRNPSKNLPRALISAIVIVAIIYVSIITITNSILGQDLIGQQAPLQVAFGKIAGNLGMSLIAAGSIISMLGIVIHASFESPRSGQSMAQQGALPKPLATLNHNGVPARAIIITSILTLLLTLSGQFETLAQLSVVARFAQYIPTILAVIYFQLSKKGPAASIKLPLGPVIPMIAVILSVWLLTQAEPALLLFGLFGLLVAAASYFITKALLKK